MKYLKSPYGLTAALLTAVGLGLVALARGNDAPPQPPPAGKVAVPDVLYTPESGVDLMHADVKKLVAAGDDPHKYLYLSTYNEPDQKGRDEDRTVAALAFFSLNFRTPFIVQPVPVDPAGLLLRVDVDALGIDRHALDRLGGEGSGPDPFPEPYYHYRVSVGQNVQEAVVAEEGRGQDPCRDGQGRLLEDDRGRTLYLNGDEAALAADGRRYQWQGHPLFRPRPAVRERHAGKPHAELAVAPWIDQAKFLYVAQQVGSEFPLFRADWFNFYALQPPAYLHFQGDPKTLADVEKLAGLPPEGAARKGELKRQLREHPPGTKADLLRLAGDLGVELRAVSLHSEVANQNRILERQPTKFRHGRASFLKSYDFLSSRDRKDVYKDPLLDEPDADEVLWMTPCGSIGMSLNDGREKILASADPRIALDNRTYLHDKIVYSGRCMWCHPSGPVLLADEVRLRARGRRALSEADPLRALLEQDRYFTDDINTELALDQATYLSALRRACATSGPDAWLLHQRKSWEYQDRELVMGSVCLETGYPLAAVRPVIEEAGRVGLDHTFVRMLQGGRGRRDQFETAFGQLMQILVRVPEKKE